MKCLTYRESENWFASLDVRIDENRFLSLQRRSTDLKTTIPQKSLSLIYFADRIANWFSADTEVMIWPSHWEIYPPGPLDLFERVRRSEGETRSLVDAPGHIINKLLKQETDVAVELIFLIMAFNWTGYIAGKDSHDYCCLGDEFILISSKTEDRLWAAAELVKVFKLNQLP
jgi:hypothetical protein